MNSVIKTLSSYELARLMSGQVRSCHVRLGLSFAFLVGHIRNIFSEEPQDGVGGTLPKTMMVENFTMYE
jgi:hypothetical protein